MNIYLDYLITFLIFTSLLVLAFIISFFGFYYKRDEPYVLKKTLVRYFILFLLISVICFISLLIIEFSIKESLMKHFLNSILMGPTVSASLYYLLFIVYIKSKPKKIVSKIFFILFLIYLIIFPIVIYYFII